MLLAAAMGLTCVPLAAAMEPTAVLAASAAETDKQFFDYKVMDGEVCITGSTNNLPAEVVIPAEIDGMPVTSIGYMAFQWCSGMTSITLPDSVKTIGDYAFSNCTGLTGISIPDSVTSIGKEAFASCRNLTNVTIPDSVTSIGIRAFSNTAWLKARQEENPLVIVGSILIDATKCTGDVTIPDGVKSIGDYAFSDCKDLTGVILPEGLTSFGNAAFKNCSGLESITIPDGVESIGVEAFASCSSLTGITLPDSVTSIGSYAFSGTPWFTGQQEEDPLVIVNNILIDGRSCTGDVTIPDGVTSICDNAFRYCAGLESISIPDSVTSIGEYAFSNCTKLTSVKLPKGLTSIESYTFQWCTVLNDITIPDSVTSIGDYAFWDCYKLAGVRFPENLTSIGDDAFKECGKLESITLPEGLESIGDSAFFQCGLTSVTIPDSVTYIGSSAFSATPWMKARKEENPLVIESDILIDATTCSGDVTIPDGVTSISGLAFSSCKDVTSITIPDSVTSIGVYAFSGCSGLLSITIPDSMTSIGRYAFSGCSSLPGITLPDSVTSIESYIFSSCKSLTSVILPDGVTSIGENAFQECTSLTSIVIPDSVTSIGLYPFLHCNKLTIMGQAGSYAESFANSSNIPFKIYEPVPTEPSTEPTEPPTEPTTAPTEPVTDPTEAATEGITDPDIGKTYKLRISVVDDETGKPLSNVRVEYPGGSWLSDGTTFEGTYEFRGKSDKNGANLDRIYLFYIPEGYSYPGSDYFDEPLPNDYTITHGEDVDVTFRIPHAKIVDPEVAFKPVLDMFRTNVSEGWKNFKGKTAEGILLSDDLYTVSPLWLTTLKDKTLDEVGYYYGNGVLYISVIQPSYYSSARCAYDVYTLKDDKIIHLCSGDEAHEYYYGLDELRKESEDWVTVGYSWVNFVPVPKDAMKYDSETGKYMISDITVADDGSYIYDWIGTENPRAHMVMNLTLLSGSTIQPSTQPWTEPTTQPWTEPVTDPTEPMTDPVTDPTEPTTKPTEPPTEPTEQPTKPSQPVTEPVEVIYTVELPEIPVLKPGDSYSFEMKLTFADGVNMTALKTGAHIVENVYRCEWETVHFNDQSATYMVPVKLDIFENASGTCKLSLEDVYAFLQDEDRTVFSKKQVKSNTVPVRIEADDPVSDDTLGDLDGDGIVNASDAARVLIAAAAMGAGDSSGLTDAQMTAADVNNDGTVNASDAAIILIYAAAVGAGETDAKITDFVH